MGRWLSISDAANMLGVSKDALRKRIRRQNIEAKKAEDGTWLVLVEQDNVLDNCPTTDLLVQELRDRIAFLENQLRSRDDEIKRRDSIIMSLSQRVPELPDPADRARREAEHAELLATVRDLKRPWWKRWRSIT